MLGKERIEAKDRVLADFFDSRGASKFTVPDYQRRFVWKTKQLIDFIDAIYQNDSGYFVGTFVLVGPDHRTYEMQILDGQQRISTICLVLRAIHDHFSKQDSLSREDEEMLINIEKIIYKGEKLDKNVRLVFNDKFTQNIFRFLMTDDDPLADENIHNWIKELEQKTKNSPSFEKSAEKKSVTKLYSNYQDIVEYLSQLSDTELRVLYKKIFELQIIELICKDERIVNSLFEGLNSKGIKLTNSELIKNKLYKRISEIDAPTIVKENWEGLDLIFYAASQDNLIDKYLRHFYIAKFGYISGNDLYDKYSQEINDKDNDLQKYSAELLRYGEYYLAISGQKLTPQAHPMKLDEGAYTAFNTFGALDNEQIYEVLLALLLLHNQSAQPPLKTKDLKVILNKFWIFCFRAKFLPISPSGYERKFASYCQKIKEWSKNGKDIFRESLDFINNNLFTLVGDEEQLINAIAEDFEYKGRNIRLLTKVFSDILSLEAPVRYKDPSIEHIIPQSSEKKWGLKKAVTQNIVHELGNLTLLDKTENWVSENETFEYKLENCYSKSAFKFNRDLERFSKEFSSGDIIILTDLIERRGREIAKLIVDTYSLY